MNIKCPKCKQTIHSKIGNHWYKESGLNNVFIENIIIYECTCGVSIPSVFRAARLDDLISEVLLSKPAILDGVEISFLRKNLFLSSIDFSRILGVGKTTVSKWENGRQPHSEINDRFIRILYMNQKGISGKNAQRILSNLGRIRLKKPEFDFLITAQKINNDYTVKLEQISEAQTQESLKIIAPEEAFFHPLAHQQSFEAMLQRIKSPLKFSSTELLKTSTMPFALGL